MAHARQKVGLGEICFLGRLSGGFQLDVVFLQGRI